MKNGYRFGAFLQEGGPAIILTAEDFLYPQYDYRIDDFIQASKRWLQMMAEQLLETDRGTSEVRQRWQKIADGSFFEQRRRL